jgi:hypothetical protein
MSSAGFRAATQPLLKDLKVFRLAWLQAYPFTGEKLKTGGWVGENWNAITRLSKIIYAWCSHNHDLAPKFGGDDVARMVISFNALVARCLTHSGVDDAFIAETDLYMKEFMSSVKELDIRIHHKVLNQSLEGMNKKGKKIKKKKTEAWWLKANYMSLPNLLSMMHLLGPLVLWWDGGGKGERFIQSVKPHIKRGIREDVHSFFERLLQKLFKVQQVELLEKRYGLSDNGVGASSDADDDAGTEAATVLDILNEVADAMSIPEEEELSLDSNDEDDSIMSSSSYGNSEEAEAIVEDEDAHFSTMEEHGMTKTKTIYIFRNENHLNEWSRGSYNTT